MDDPCKDIVCGYLLIKTRTIDSETTNGTDPCDDESTDPLERLACRIKTILEYYEDAVDECIRGSIVESTICRTDENDNNVKCTEEPELTIIVSFAAKDDETFDEITERILRLSAPANSEVHVREVTKAKHQKKPTGFEGLP